MTVQVKRVALVVEDDPAASKLIRVSLTKLNIEVHTAPNGEQASQFLETHSFDLICLDLMLPNQSGFELCEIIRSHPKHRSVPVLIISARNEPEAQAFAEEAGANGYLLKPFKRSDLEAHALRLLGLPAPRSR